MLTYETLRSAFKTPNRFEIFEEINVPVHQKFFDIIQRGGLRIMISSQMTEGQPLLNQITQFFMSIPFFEGINLEEIKVIARHIAVMDVTRGDVIFNEADRGNYICFISSGCFNVSVRKDEGKEVTLATLSRGQSIGEMAIIEDLPRFATITAIEDSRLFVLSKSAFDLILSKHPYIGIKLLKGVAIVLSNNLRQTSMKLVGHL
jgi:CRP-like cAMP-binding protein